MASGHLQTNLATTGRAGPVSCPDAPSPSFKLIPVTQGKFAIVDAEDFEWLSRYKWHARKDRHTWYAVRNTYQDGKQKLIFMHREILKLPKGTETDHKDHDGLNNRRSNIRPATRAQNQHNQNPQKRGTSKFKGVHWCRNERKWRAQIQVEGHRIYCGYYTSEIEAARAYDRAALNFFGEFAYTNGVGQIVLE